MKSILKTVGEALCLAAFLAFIAALCVAFNA